MEKHVTIDLKDPANASELEEAEVGDCVYLRVVEKTGDSIVGTVEQIEPMEDDVGEEDEANLPPGAPMGSRQSGRPKRPKGVTLIIAGE